MPKTSKPQTPKAKAPAPSPALKGAPTGEAAPPADAPPVPKGKLATLVALLQRSEGATVADMAEATGWKMPSVRGAMAGSLRHRGFVIVSDKPNDVRLYRIVRSKPEQ